jgi:hypothetical protein
VTAVTRLLVAPWAINGDGAVIVGSEAALCSTHCSEKEQWEVSDKNLKSRLGESKNAAESYCERLLLLR